ncbi:hypothetical protein BG000_007029 [Podila horticola]|nr:hypothetical protein BG000_007029 [Podila horticola]
MKIRCRHIESGTKSREQAGPELGTKSGVTVRYDRGRESVQADDILKKQVGKVLGRTGRSTRNKMRGF